MIMRMAFSAVCYIAILYGRTTSGPIGEEYFSNIGSWSSIKPCASVHAERCEIPNGNLIVTDIYNEVMELPLAFLMAR
jgi:hypothetical protein